MYILNNPQRCKMVGCWLVYMHCLAALKSPYIQASCSLFIFPVICQLHNITHQAMESGWHLQCNPIMMIVHFWYRYISCHYLTTSLHFTVGIVASEIKGTQIQIKKEVSTVLVKKRLRIGRDSSRLLRVDKIANPSRLYYREVHDCIIAKFTNGVNTYACGIRTATVVVRIS